MHTIRGFFVKSGLFLNFCLTFSGLFPIPWPHLVARLQAENKFTKCKIQRIRKIKDYYIQQTITKWKTMEKGKVKKNPQKQPTVTKKTVNKTFHMKLNDTKTSSHGTKANNSSQYSQENTFAIVSFLIKLQVAQVFSCEFCEISKNNFFIEHFCWLLLKWSWNKKYVVILDDSITKLLNGWEMTKRIQSDCKIYVKSFSGATVSCMEDYMKPSIRNSPEHFILHVGTNDLYSEKSSKVLQLGVGSVIYNFPYLIKLCLFLPQNLANDTCLMST